MRLVSRRSIVTYITKATPDKNAEISFVSHRSKECKLLASSELPFTYSEKYSGIDEQTGNVLNNPTILAL